MISSGDALKSLAIEAALSPQEEMLEVGRKKQSLHIGIPKETEFQEQRVALVPESVGFLVSNGHKVLIESGAGEKANFSDNDYSESGAEISYDTKEVYKADIILKVTPPSVQEIEMMKYKQILFSALQLTVQPKNALKKLMEKKITAIAWDYIEDEDGSFPIIRSMGEIAGTTAVLIAAELMSSSNNGKGLMLGNVAGITPPEMVIIGAGTVGQFAASAALSLGVSVKVFDNSIYRLRRLQRDIGNRVFTSVIQPKVLIKALRRCDVAIGALRVPHGRTPCVVSEEMVKTMKSGSVIVDVSIDKGGCFETSKITTHEKPTFKAFDVTHYCVPNIASSVSRTASYGLSNIFSPLLIEISERGGCDKLIQTEKGFRHGVYIYKGTLTSSFLGETFNLPYKDLDLLISAL
ncbi:MAG: alanine dehydrogenase [Crocinitomicaceae bacterium]|nr:alanine dehydrogenase [Crocinitomicaceae bacterium]|tara:strand:- start:5479 stop:6699 length:1221 start_codon:yes stop_codon:yes gene_type:complete